MRGLAVFAGAVLVNSERDVIEKEPASILYVDENSVAAKAGLQSNDRITRVDGVNNPTWEIVINKIAIGIGRPLSLEVARGNQVLPKELLVNSTDVADNDVRLVEQLGIAVEP